MNAAAVAIVLEAAREDGDVAAAGFRLALWQLHGDEADGLPREERQARFEQMAAATAKLLDE